MILFEKKASPNLLERKAFSSVNIMCILCNFRENFNTRIDNLMSLCKKVIWKAGLMHVRGKADNDSQN